MNSKTLLTGLFITSLITAQLTASKLVPITIPLIGLITFPAGTIAYAGTYLATDTLGELYGKAEAASVVKTGFLMNFVMLALVYVAVALPTAQTGIGGGMFETVLLSSTNIVLGSLAAYLVSQFVDVTLFHALKSGTRLWQRNILSTSVSQSVDTVLFTGVAFYVAPKLLGIGHALPVSVLVSLVVGQTLLKAVIAVVDTPLVYAVVRSVR